MSTFQLIILFSAVAATTFSLFTLGYMDRANSINKYFNWGYSLAFIHAGTFFIYAAFMPEKIIEIALKVLG